MAGSALNYTSSEVFASASSVTLHDFRAHEDVVQGMLVYLRSDNKWAQTNALLGSRGGQQDQIKGVAVNGAYANQPLSVCISDPQFTFGTAAAVKGRTYVASDTVAGSMMRETAANPVAYRIVGGVAVSTTALSLILKSTGATSV